MTIDELFAAHYRGCVLYARRLTRSRADAEDACQGAFVSALGNMPLLSSLAPGQIRSWLRTAIRNRLYDELRRQHRARKITSELSRCDGSIRPTFDELLLRNLLVELTGLLPVHDQELIYRRYWLAMSSAEIGREMGIPASTVRYRLSVARKKLRKLYEGEVDETEIR